VAVGMGGLQYSLIASAVAIGASFAFVVSQPPAASHPAVVTFLAVAGVTAAGVLVSRSRRRQDRELAETRLIADVAQRVLLRPLPSQVGPVSFAVRYMSASSGARIGGDLYEVVTTAGCVRLLLGDAEGKGLTGVASAAAVLGVFREAAHEESSLAAIASRMETSLARQLDDEQFVTAILAEISPGAGRIELLNCGHPQPLLLRQGQVRFIGPEQNSLPLGLSQLADVPRTSLVIPFESGDQVLFYTDGASEARNKSGEFFPLADSACVHSAPDPATFVDRLSDEVIRHVGHAPDDDVALLLAARGAGLGAAPPALCRRLPAAAPGSLTPQTTVRKTKTPRP